MAGYHVPYESWDLKTGSGPLNLYRFNPPSPWRVPMMLKGSPAPRSLQIWTPTNDGVNLTLHVTPETSKNYGVRKLRCVATRTDLKRRRQLYVSWTVSTDWKNGGFYCYLRRNVGKYRQNAPENTPWKPQKGMHLPTTNFQVLHWF